jgi:hypothetical protein
MSIFEKGRGREPGANLARFSNFLKPRILTSLELFFPSTTSRILRPSPHSSLNLNSGLTHIPRAQSNITSSSGTSVICNQSPSTHQHHSNPRPTHQTLPTPPIMALSLTIYIPETCVILSKRTASSLQDLAAHQMLQGRSLARTRLCQRNHDD